MKGGCNFYNDRCDPDKLHSAITKHQQGCLLLWRTAVTKSNFQALRPKLENIHRRHRVVVGALSIARTWLTKRAA